MLATQVHPDVYAMVVPGSGLVKEQAIREGLDKILVEAGFDWREPGCSMCLAMNPDKLEPGERCASTSNRNFEGRQGNGGRTHLMSPQMAAAAAITGKLTDIREFGIPIVEVPQTDTLPKGEYSEVGRDPATFSASTTLGRSAGMPKFTTLKGVAAPLDIQNIDTDMIIPKQYLKTIKRSGLGVGLFSEMRYMNQDPNQLNPEFMLNKEQWKGSKILIAGNNFGCGSSREHAPWAINDFGIRAIIASAFADIFFNNCFKNGMLPIVLPESEVRKCMAEAEAAKEIEVDLPNQVVILSSGEKIPFEVDAFRKNCLIEGLDDIGLTMQKADKISVFEKRRDQEFSFYKGIAQKQAA